MTENDYQVADEVPTDGEGHPIHPERGHRICGATKSDRSTPAPHGRSRDDYDYCLQPAGWGTDVDHGSCKNHPYSGSQIGQQNPNFKHGATSEYFKSKLSERQADVYDEVAEALDDPETAKQSLRRIATQMILVGEHTHDSSMVREGRQILSEFNIVDNSDEVEVRGELNHNVDHGLSAETDQRIGQMVDALMDDE